MSRAEPNALKTRAQFALYWKQNTFERFSPFLLSQMKNFHNLNEEILVYVNSTDNPRSFVRLFSSVTCKLRSGLERAWELSALLMLIFARFEFDSAIRCTFHSFWVSFIYWFVVILRLEGFFDFFLLILGLMELFTFSWKTFLN